MQTIQNLRRAQKVNIGNPLEMHGRIQLMEQRCQLVLKIIVMYLKVPVPYSIKIHRKAFFRCFRANQAKHGERVVYAESRAAKSALFCYSVVSCATSPCSASTLTVFDVWLQTKEWTSVFLQKSAGRKHP